jgi:hypothetical protein
MRQLLILKAKSIGFILVAFITGMGISTPAKAAQLMVTSTDDIITIGTAGCADGCTLREAVETASPGDEIIFSSLFDTPQTISFIEQLVIGKNLTITGKGAHLLTVRNGRVPSSISRVFFINNPFITVNLSGITITGGRLTGSSNGGGGGIFSQGTLTISACHITDNTSEQGGGGIFNGRLLTVLNSTISNNTASGSGGFGGGIHSGSGLTVINSTISGNIVNGNQNSGGGGGIRTGSNSTIINSTITGNNVTSGSNSVGGIYSSASTNSGVVVRNSIIAGNRWRTSTLDVKGNFATAEGGYNLIGDVGTTIGFNQPGDKTGTASAPLNPLLLPLALNGGSTPTHAFSSASSPAIDAADPNNTLSKDQRGVIRPQDGNSDSLALADIGAFEFQPMPQAQNGKIAFSSNRDGNYEIYVINADGTGEQRVTTNLAADNYPAFSLNGSKITFSRTENGTQDIYVINVDGTGEQRLTFNETAAILPAFSPDGSKIAFRNIRNNNQDIYIINADGTGEQRLTTNPAFESDPAFSPDGSKIAFSSDRNGSNDIYIINVDGTGEQRLTTDVASDRTPSFSPNGSKIAFSSNRTGNGEIYLINVDGTGEQRLTTSVDGGNAFRPSFSPDGSKIAFTSDGNGSLDDIYIVNADGTGKQRVTTNLAVDIYPSWGGISVVN